MERRVLLEQHLELLLPSGRVLRRELRRMRLDMPVGVCSSMTRPGDTAVDECVDPYRGCATRGLDMSLGMHQGPQRTCGRGGGGRGLRTAH